MSQVSDYRQFLELLGLDYDESKLHEFFKSHNIMPFQTSKTSHQKWCLFEHGILIHFDKTFDRVWDIMFVRGGDEGFGDDYYRGFKSFMGALPGGVLFDDNEEIVREKASAQGWKLVDSGRGRPPVEPPYNMDEWDEFVRKQRKIPKTVSWLLYRADMFEFSFAFNMKAGGKLFSVRIDKNFRGQALYKRSSANPDAQR